MCSELLLVECYILNYERKLYYLYHMSISKMCNKLLFYVFSKVLRVLKNSFSVK